MAGLLAFTEVEANIAEPGLQSKHGLPWFSSMSFSYHTEAEVFQRKLDETTRLLRELQEAQNERLSTRPPPNMICLLGPSYREMYLGMFVPWEVEQGWAHERKNSEKV